MNSRQKVIILGLLILPIMTLDGCGATVKAYRAPTADLTALGPVHVMLATATGAMSVEGASISGGSGAATAQGNTVLGSGVASGISVTHAMSGTDQALLAAQDIAFELRSLGMSVVPKEEDAKVVALFSIGAVRYDPIAGWIADQAFLEFRNRETGETIAAFRANSQLVTPRVRSMTKALINQVRRSQASGR